MLGDPAHLIKYYELYIISRIIAFQHTCFHTVNRWLDSELISFGHFKYLLYCCSQVVLYFPGIVNNPVTSKYLLYVTSVIFHSSSDCPYERSD